MIGKTGGRRMVIEFTDGDGRGVLVNPDHVLLVQEETRQLRACIILWDGTVRINVRESFEEIKKRLGLAITPRAETLAIK